MLCISTSKRMLAHVFAWLKTVKNIWKLWKKYLFHHVHERLDTWRKMKKKVCWSAIIYTDLKMSAKKRKIPNEHPAFGSHSQWLINKLFSSFLFMRLTWASRGHDEKDTFFIIFKCFLMFSTMRTYAQAQQLDLSIFDYSFSFCWWSLVSLKSVSTFQQQKLL